MKLLLIILVLVILVTGVAFWKDIKTLSARQARRKLNRQQAMGNRANTLSVVKDPDSGKHHGRQ